MLEKLTQHQGVQLVGVDFSPRAVTVCGQRGLECLVDDANVVPLRAATFSVVTCFELLEHVDCPESVVYEVVRVTRKYGAIILSVLHVEEGATEDTDEPAQQGCE